MTTGARVWGVVAGLSGASALVVASWVSHGLPASFSGAALELALTRAHSANTQHLVHTLALLGVAVWCRVRPCTWLHVAGGLFAAGIALFSFGIYGIHLWWPELGSGGVRYLVPTGGLALILGWLALAVAALKA